MQCTVCHNFLHKKNPYLHALQGNREMGARYLNPKYSRWISVDPALGEYIPAAGKGNSENAGNLPGMGGIFNHINGDLYHYASNNPVRYIDPTGRYAYQEFEEIEDAAEDWANTYADDSIFEMQELGSSIFSYTKDGKTTYFYNIPYQGTDVDDDGNPIRDDDGNIIRGGYINRELDDGYCSKYTEGGGTITLFSGIHSHANWDSKFKTETPSGMDLKGVGKDKAKFPGYSGKEFLLTPGGILMEFDKDGVTRTIGNNFMRDIVMYFDGVDEGYFDTDEFYDLYNRWRDAFECDDLFYGYGEW